MPPVGPSEAGAPALPRDASGVTAVDDEPVFDVVVDVLPTDPTIRCAGAPASCSAKALLPPCCDPSSAETYASDAARDDGRPSRPRLLLLLRRVDRRRPTPGDFAAGSSLSVLLSSLANNRDVTVSRPHSARSCATSASSAATLSWLALRESLRPDMVGKGCSARRRPWPHQFSPGES